MRGFLIILVLGIYLVIFTLLIAFAYKFHIKEDRPCWALNFALVQYDISGL